MMPLRADATLAQFMGVFVGMYIYIYTYVRMRVCDGSLVPPNTAIIVQVGKPVLQHRFLLHERHRLLPHGPQPLLRRRRGLVFVRARCPHLLHHRREDLVRAVIVRAVPHASTPLARQRVVANQQLCLASTAGVPPTRVATTPSDLQVRNCTSGAASLLFAQPVVAGTRTS